ncbi:mitochondrial glycoprotein [Pholiota conissans]|uniref:Mitochondrial glycoprotein n=1 Tax=Pholiota conissans TaxID=109636 RepID=A0A9P5Z395_9AGAR|nr:mitochondrial glycoprotein [Pholiota conissans]
MSPIAALRTAARVGPARLVAGMRLSAARPSLAAAARFSPATTMTRAFSVSAGRFGSGTTDIALSAKLQEELQYEKSEMAQAGDATPDFLKSFTEQGIWAINDVRGNDEVTLSRKFGDENIRIMFSIADIQQEDDYENEHDAEGEEEDAPPATALPIRASVSITKTTAPGAINVDMICQEGSFSIENISFYDDAKVGTELTAEADWNRRGLYIGPQFDTLDVAVQDAFDAFIAERGINESVAFFIPEYAAYKEQQEYVKWLGKVKSFIDL